MKTIDIHGRPYVTVSERVKHFHEVFPDWSITTEIVKADENMAIIKAIILDPDYSVRYTGHAFELKQNTGINKNSHLENCETSAVGRALAFMGIGIDGGIASLDEIISARQVEYVQKLLDLAAISEEDAEKIRQNMTTMTTGDAEQVIRFLQSNQLDPIESGAGYKMRDIHNRLDKIMSDPKK